MSVCPPFLGIGTMFLFRWRNTSFKALIKNYFQRFIYWGTTYSQHAYTLFGFRFWITFAMLLWEKFKQDKRLSVKYWTCDESLLQLLIKGRCVAKWELKSSAFSLKFVRNLFSWNKGEIRGIFLFFERRLKFGLPRPKKTVLFTSFESPLKMMNNAFYFTLKAFFVLKIFKFLSWRFGYLKKRLD